MYTKHTSRPCWGITTVNLQALRGGARSSIVMSSFQYSGMTSRDEGLHPVRIHTVNLGSSTSHTDRPDRNRTKMCLLHKEDNIK